MSADGSNAAAGAGSVASVMLRQLRELATRNGGALILVSLGPPPVVTTAESGGGKFVLLRRAAYAKLEAGCSGLSNVRLTDTGSAIYKSVGSSSSEAYISEAGHFTPAGIKKLSKVWSNKIIKFLA